MIRFLSKPIIRNKEEQTKFRWMTFWWLLVVFVLAAIANIPNSRAVRELTSQTVDLGNQSIFQSIIGNAGAALVMGSKFIWIGLWLSARANLGAPLITKAISGKSFSDSLNRRTVITSIVLGASTGFLMLGLLKIQEYVYPIGTAKFEHPSAIPNLFASFSAGITEAHIDSKLNGC